jgi:hypothetical protein
MAPMIGTANYDLNIYSTTTNSRTATTAVKIDRGANEKSNGHGQCDH